MSSVTATVDNYESLPTNISSSLAVNVTEIPTHPYISLTEKIIEVIILILINMVALGGNVLLYSVVIRNKSLRTTSNALVLCLSGADILVSIVNMPMTIVTVIHGNKFFTDGLCVLLGFASMTFFISSVMSLAAISLNRYVLIVHPNRFKRIYTVRNTGFVIMIVWLLSLSLASPPLLGWAKYDFLPGQSFCFCSWKQSKSYTFFMVFVCFGGPCSVMSFCYYKILLEVRKSRKRIAAATDASSMNSENSALKAISNNYSSSRMGNGIPPDGKLNSAFIGGESLELVNKTPLVSIHDAVTKQLTKRLAKVDQSSACETDQSGTTNEVPHVPNSIEESHQSTTVGKSNLTSVEPICLNPSSSTSKRDCRYQQAGSGTKTPKIRVQEPSLHRIISSDSRRGSLNSLIGEDTRSSEKEKIPGKSSPKRGPVVQQLSSSMLAVPGLKAAIGARKRRSKTASEKRRKQEELKLTKSFLVVILVFIICWFPYCITMFWGAFFHSVPRPVDMSSLLLGFFNSCCNPIIYGVMNTRFRAGYKQILCCIFAPCNCNKTVPSKPRRSLGSLTGTIGAGYQDDMSYTA